MLSSESVRRQSNRDPNNPPPGLKTDMLEFEELDLWEQHAGKPGQQDNAICVLLERISDARSALE